MLESKHILGTADPAHFGANPSLVPFRNLPLPHFPSFLLFYLPPVGQEVTAKSTREVWGVLRASQVGSGGKPGRKRSLVYIEARKCVR